MIEQQIQRENKHVKLTLTDLVIQLKIDDTHTFSSYAINLHKDRAFIIKKYKLLSVHSAGHMSFSQGNLCHHC